MQITALGRAGPLSSLLLAPLSRAATELGHWLLMTGCYRL